MSAKKPPPKPPELCPRCKRHPMLCECDVSVEELVERKGFQGALRELRQKVGIDGTVRHGAARSGAERNGAERN